VSLERRIAAIERAPSGRRVGAFFDFDGTLIDGYSAMAMMRSRAQSLEIGPAEATRLVLAGVKSAVGRSDFHDFMRVGVQAFAGREREELDRLGERLARGVLGGCLFPEAWELIAAHQRRGHRVIVATSALPFQVEPLARELEVDDVLCTRLAASGGVLTGEIDGDILWGAPKAAAVRAHARRRRVTLRDSFAYANGDEDVDFLEAVGNPCAVNPQDELERCARGRAWPVEEFRGRARPGATDAVRTFAAYGGMAASLGVGVGLGLLNRSRRDAVNLSASIGSDVALSLAGVNVDVTGERHLWSHRPAVFVFNHQSWLDGLVVMKLLRADLTGVAKKEVARQPGFGQFARLANMAFVDRANGAAAKQALAPAVERLREGYSIAIAPEGTRSTTPRLGRFKKGAFHLAMQGGVPIVPVVIRNAGERLWRGSTVIRPGPLDVIVHPPIPVDGWRRGELSDRVAEVRALFADTLADWDAAKARALP
jgi:putative phosphoserine phosphatase/1-acylglycerol-3-phosphate O-acyltransferase